MAQWFITSIELYWFERLVNLLLLLVAFLISCLRGTSLQAERPYSYPLRAYLAPCLAHGLWKRGHPQFKDIIQIIIYILLTLSMEEQHKNCFALTQAPPKNSSLKTISPSSSYNSYKVWPIKSLKDILSIHKESLNLLVR